MPQIDFYILHTASPGQVRERDRFVCQLTDKIWHQGYSIYIQTISLVQAKLLDDLLWTFKPESFLPHDIYPDEASSTAPIRLSYTEQAYDGIDVLINLTEKVPTGFHQFKRIAEIVIDTPQAREAGRQRYRFYREPGNELKTHDIQR